MEKINFTIFLVVFALISAAAATTKFVKTTYGSIEEFRILNPNVELIEMEVFVNPLKNTRSYSVGARQTGDLVVANASNKNKWPQAQNVSTTLSYPPSGGQGAFLTYILINCDQSSNLGNAYITAGGVQQHFVQIVVEAQVTTYFNYAALFYGFK